MQVYLNLSQKGFDLDNPRTIEKKYLRGPCLAHTNVNRDEVSFIWNEITY